MEHLYIFLSSPGDVSRERQLAREVIDRLESERAHRDRLKLEVVAWDKPGVGTAMPAQMEPQEAINHGLKKPSQCDIVIVIFWARMGTILSEKYLKSDGSRYRSGTEYEFLDALGAAKKSGKPDVLVYRRKDPPDLKMRDPERKEKERQWELVEEFFAEFRNPDGSYWCYVKEYGEPSDFNDMLDEDLRDIITTRLDSRPPAKAEVAPVTEKPSWQDSPFPGLRAFLPDEALIFHGRGREIDGLINKLSSSECRFIAVVGASGSGKSSLVAAGVLPALKKNAIHGSADWIWVRFTPGEMGNNPFMELAGAFKATLESHGIKPRDVAAELENNVVSLQKFTAMVLQGRPDWTELLLFVDQFEELFTLVAKEYQEPFVNLLALAAKTPRARAVVTMRADFYHRCLEWPVLHELIIKGQYTLLVPKTGALHEMITRPAEVAGLRFEEGLEQRILDDTGIEPGALALMAYALSELWRSIRDSKRVLTHAAYDSFHGVRGAIGKRAEDTFKETLKALKSDEAELQAALTGVFRELIEVNERGDATRKRILQRQVAKEAVAAALVRALTDSRLLVTGRGEGNAAVVEVAHEAIFTHWPRLKNWVAATSDAHRLRRQVRESAEQWDARGQARKYLWPDERVVEAADMLERLGLKIEDLSGAERCFLGPIDRDAMLAALEDATTTHEIRATIGVRLSLLGDPRPGVGLRADGLPDIVWCAVPGGKVTLEEGAGTFNVKEFYIAKYLVTWKQYRTFEADDGFKESRWWDELAYPGRSPGLQFNQYDNLPAENVAWVEAVAFCRWLSAKVGYEVRLPTEWEWQQAATGGDSANEYPWGPWDSSRANTYESDLQRSTAVGMYPRGISPAGALDMSGNLCEWCLNEFENPERTEISGDKSRALRGGSWYFNRYPARCIYRLKGSPNGRNHDLGFRLVCASPIS